jgi:uncharacterized protein (DUF169 family)
MDSIIASEIKLKSQPVAIIFTNDKIDNALQFAPGKWGCTISMLNAVTKGKTALFDRVNRGCAGGQAGLGLGNYSGFPGGIEYFLSTGKEGFREGEFYKKNPELGKKFADNLETKNIPFTYVVFKPLNIVDMKKDNIIAVTFLVNPDQLTAMVVLANYDRPTNDNVMAPMAAGCQSICLIPYNDSFKEPQKAVIGLLDVSARAFVDKDILSFTVPLKMFLEMENNVKGSFLEKKAWQKLRERI